VNTQPNFALSAAMRMSHGKVSVSPTPAAEPLKATIEGLRQFMIAAMKLALRPSLRPPKFLAPSPLSVSNDPAPAETSAPAQNTRPNALNITTRIESSASAWSNAAASSAPIVAV